MNSFRSRKIFLMRTKIQFQKCSQLFTLFTTAATDMFSSIHFYQEWFWRYLSQRTIEFSFNKETIEKRSASDDVFNIYMDVSFNNVYVPFPQRSIFIYLTIIPRLISQDFLSTAVDNTVIRVSFNKETKTTDRSVGDDMFSPMYAT